MVQEKRWLYSLQLQDEILLLAHAKGSCTINFTEASLSPLPGAFFFFKRLLDEAIFQPADTSQVCTAGSLRDAPYPR